MLTKEQATSEFPSKTDAAKWLEDRKAEIRAVGKGLAHGLAVFNAAPEGRKALMLAKRCLVAAAHMAASMTFVKERFEEYMPLSSVGYHWHHRLLKIAYEIPAEPGLNWLAWLPETKEAVAAVHDQYRNADWVWQMKEVFEFAITKLK